MYRNFKTIYCWHSSPLAQIWYQITRTTSHLYPFSSTWKYRQPNQLTSDLTPEQLLLSLSRGWQILGSCKKRQAPAATPQFSEDNLLPAKLCLPLKNQDDFSPHRFSQWCLWWLTSTNFQLLLHCRCEGRKEICYKGEKVDLYWHLGLLRENNWNIFWVCTSCFSWAWAIRYTANDQETSWLYLHHSW